MEGEALTPGRPGKFQPPPPYTLVEETGNQTGKYIKPFQTGRWGMKETKEGDVAGWLTGSRGVVTGVSFL